VSRCRPEARAASDNPGTRATVCRETDCPVADEPPPGEAWCRYRLGLELARWFFGYPMEAGEAKPVAL